MTGASAGTVQSSSGSIEFALTVTMDSDWHIGAGAGRNRTVDRLVDRDEDGVPVIRSSTLRGMWRDGAETLARGLDEISSADSRHGRQPWARFVDELLGSEPQIAVREARAKDFERPIGSRVRLGDARLGSLIRRHLALSNPGCAALREALTFIKPGVEIDPESGTALDDHLRFEEVARAGAVLHAAGSFECPEADQVAAAAFLVAAAAFIERLGGKRRRGMGTCRVEMRFVGTVCDLPSTAAQAAEILERQVGPPAPAERDLALQAACDRATGTGAWRRLDLRLTLRSPVVIADAVLGNIVTTRDHIPGSQLLPHAARTLERAGVADVGKLVTIGDLRVLPAYPEIDAARGLPVPFSWRQPKLGGKLSSSFRESKTDAPQLKPLRVGYVAPGGVRFSKARMPTKVIRTHNTVEDSRQKPTEVVGGVYSYEALAPGQAFRSQVWVRAAEVDEETLRSALNGRAHIGRARNAGYGEIDIEALGTPADAPTAIPQGSGIVYVLLETDVLLRVPDLGTGGNLEALLSALEAGLGHPGETIFDRTATRAELRTRRTESWQSGWGLPRPSLIAMQAGSVVELVCKDAVTKPTADQFNAIEREGIGERRAEGFGRIRINPKLVIELPEEDRSQREPSGDPRPPTPLDIPAGPERDFLAHVERIAWQRAIEQRADYFAAHDLADKLKWTGFKPPMSQLGALRAIMGRYQSSAEFKAAEAWCAKLALHPKGKEKWPDDSVKALGGLLDQTGPRTAWDWLRLPAATTGEATTPAPADLGWGGAAVPAPLVFKPEEMLEHHGRFAVRTLLHAAMRAHKRAIENRDGGEPQDLDQAEADA